MAEPATNIETTTAVRITRWIEQEKRTNAIKGIDPARADLETEAYPPDMCTSFRHQTDCVQEKQTLAVDLSEGREIAVRCTAWGFY